MEKRFIYFFAMIMAMPLVATQEVSRWVHDFHAPRVWVGEFSTYAKQQVANQQLLRATAKPGPKALAELRRAERAGADLNCTDSRSGDTPLIVATREGNQMVMTYLLQKREVDHSATNRAGESAVSILDKALDKQKFLLRIPYYALGMPPGMAMQGAPQPVGLLPQ